MLKPVSLCPRAQKVEPSLASFMHSNILMHASLDKSMAFLLANKLASRTLLSTQLQQLFKEAYKAEPVRRLLPLACRPLVPAPVA